MADARTKIQESYGRIYTGRNEKLRKKMKELDEKNTDYLRIGDRVIRPRRPGSAAPTPKPSAPKAPTTSEDRISKVTFGFGKDKQGKPIGQTTWVDLGKNPSSEKQARGERMARNLPPTAPKAKAPRPTEPSTKATYSPKWKPFDVAKEVEKHNRLSPHLPGDPHDKTTPMYVWKRESNPYLKDQKKSLAATKVAKAIGAAGALATGAALIAKTMSRKPSEVKLEVQAAKRSKSEAVKTRTPKPAAAKPEMSEALAKARASGLNPREKNRQRVKWAIEAAERADAKKNQAAPKPRSILELEEPKAPKVETPKVETPQVQTAPAQPQTPKKRGFFQNLREAFMPEDEYKEVQAARKAVAAPKVEVPKVEAPAAAAPAAETPTAEGKVSKVVKAPVRAAKKVNQKAKNVAAKVQQGVKDAMDENIEETRAARAAKKKAQAQPSVEAPAAGETPIEDMTPDQREAKRKELKERIARGQAQMEADKKKKAANKPPKAKKPPAQTAVQHPTKDIHGETVVAATPAEAEEARQRDIARAKAHAEKLRADIAKAEAEQGNVSTEQKIETTPDERPQQPRAKAPRRVEGRRQQSDRFTKSAAEELLEGSSRPVGPKQSTRRGKVKDRRSQGPAIQTPDVSAEQDLAKQLEAARAENIALGGSEAKKAKESSDERWKRQAAEAGVKRKEWKKVNGKNVLVEVDTPAPKFTAAEKFGATEAEVEAVAKSGETTKPPTAAQKKANKKALSEAPQDVQDMAKQVEAAQAKAAKLRADIEAAEVGATAHETSRAATDREETKAAAKTETKQEFTPWSDEKLANSTPEERAAYRRDLMTIIEGETPEQKSARKKAAQKFFKDKQKRLEERGSFRKGTSTAVNPAVVGAEPSKAPKEPTYKQRRPTEELIKEQGIEVKVLPPKEAVEPDEVTEEWERKKQNAEAAKHAQRTPLEQAKLTAEELGIQISETQARTGTLGSKIREAAGLTSDMADFQGKRIIQSKLTSKEGEAPEFETRILEGDALAKTVAEAQEDRRKGEDRRVSTEKTRRNFQTRSTIAEAEELVGQAERERRMAGMPEDKSPIGARKGSRRQKQPGGDRRQAGSTWTPPNVAEQVEAAAKPENKRPGGGWDRRGPTVLDLNTQELRDAAVRGDPIAKEILKQQLAERRGREKGRRAEDKAAREYGRLARDIEFEEQGLGKAESRLTWDPKARHPVPAPQMDVETDLMPEVRVYSGDPIRANTVERMDKRIAALEKRLNTPGAPEVYKGHELLAKMKRQRAGLQQEAEAPPNTRQFPRAEDVKAEGARVPGEKVIPNQERREHVRNAEGRRVVLKTPERRKRDEQRATQRRTQEVELPEGTEERRVEERRNPYIMRDEERVRRQSPHVGPERGSYTRPAPDMTVGEVKERERPKTWVREDPEMWSKALERAEIAARAKPLTSPAIGIHVGNNIRDALGRLGGKIAKGAKNPKAVGIGLAGLGATAGLFAAPDIASAYMDTSGTQKDRIKAAGGQALESGMEVGAGMTIFTGLVEGAKRIAPQAAKGAIGLGAELGGAATVGWVAGTTAADVWNRYRRVRDKNRREAEYTRKNYGTVEAATRTRHERNRTLSIPEIDAILDRWDQEEAKKNRRNP